VTSALGGLRSRGDAREHKNIRSSLTALTRRERGGEEVSRVKNSWRDSSIDVMCKSPLEKLGVKKKKTVIEDGLK